MTQAPPKRDRRIERTRQLLSKALMDLIVERGYDDITIQDITDRANVSRTTFYLHFKDKEELLFTSMQAIYDGLLGGHEGMLPTSSDPRDLTAEDCHAEDFEHVAEYADFYRVMLSDNGSIRFVWEVMSYLARIMQPKLEQAANEREAKLPPSLIGAFLAGGQIGVTKWWLENDMACSPQEMARMHFLIAALGFRWALGWEEDGRNRAK